MTPGQEALIEAMRLEQARIYSQTLRESSTGDVDRAVHDVAGSVGSRRVSQETLHKRSKRRDAGVTDIRTRRDIA